jgi:hypothetical protein
MSKSSSRNARITENKTNTKQKKMNGGKKNEIGITKMLRRGSAAGYG